MLHHRFNLQINWKYKHALFSPKPSSLCWSDKTSWQDSRGEEPLQPSSLISWEQKMNWRHGLPGVPGCFIPHLISCTSGSKKAPHIIECLRQTGSGNALPSGRCHWAEGWPPSQSYLWAFLYRQAERSRAEQWNGSDGWGHLLAAVVERFLSLHTQTTTEEGNPCS